MYERIDLSFLEQTGITITNDQLRKKMNNTVGNASYCINNHTIPVSSSLRIWPAIAIGTIIIIALIGNLAMLFFTVSIKRLHTSTNIIIANVALNDILITIIIMPMCFTVSLIHTWPFDCASCEVYGFLDMILYNNALCSLAILSINRYYAIVCAMDPNFVAKMSIKRAKIMIITTWAYSAIWATPPIFGWNRYVFYFSKLMCNMFQRDSSQYVVLVTLFCTVLPTFTILYCSGRVVITLWKNAKNTSLATSNRQRVERRVTFMIGLILLAYVICIAPNFIVGSLYSFDLSQESELIKYNDSQTITTAIYFSNSAVNPIINGAMNPYLRRAVRERYHWLFSLFNFRHDPANPVVQRTKIKNSFSQFIVNISAE